MPPGAAVVPGAGALGKSRAKRAAAGSLVVSEIPYGVQKGKLIEAIADLINDKKLPILADVRDESDEEIRIVHRTAQRARSMSATLMDSLFRLTDLEVRVPLNLNVLDADGPRA